MTVWMCVEKVANLKHQAFGVNPEDPGNTVASGKRVQEITFSVIPDKQRGGRGTFTLQLNEPQDIGTFEPGAKVKMELTVER